MRKLRLFAAALTLIIACTTGACLAETKVMLSFAGDCTLGGNVKAHDRYFQNMVDSKGYAYFLENVKHIFAADDLTVINLEGPFTKATNMRPERKFNFKCDPANVQILLEGSVEVANLANNHAYDFMEKGYTETIDTLTNAGISSYGYDRILDKDVNSVTVRFVGLTESGNRLEDITKKVEAAKEGCDILIVTFHWGEENNYRPTFSQPKLALAAIEAGADLVVGHHTHVIGAIGNIEGVNVVYSLGNFCFGGNAMPKDMDTYIYTHVFTLDDGKNIVSQEYNVIPIILNNDSYRNNLQPTIAEGERLDSILAKIRKYSDVEITYIEIPR